MTDNWGGGPLEIVGQMWIFASVSESNTEVERETNGAECGKKMTSLDKNKTYVSTMDEYI